MNLDELRKKDISELNKLVLELKKKLNKINFKFSSSKPKNTKEAGNIKKDTARILTLLNEKNNPELHKP